jgi:hypothetical protein
MGRFKAIAKDESVSYKTNPSASTGMQPFKEIYACKEEDYIFVNMEAVDELQKQMETKRDMYVVVDISGSMSEYYRNEYKKVQNVVHKKSTGLLGGLRGLVGLPNEYDSVEYTSKKTADSEIFNMLRMVLDSIIPYDDDGVDVFFFSQGLVHKACISSVESLKEELDTAIGKRGAFSTTNPIECFEIITDQIISKRPGTIFFLTDGYMDDNGVSLRGFYQRVLHERLKTREKFYCYAIEFGKSAQGALDMLDGLYSPEGGPEDLFDKENFSNLDEIGRVLEQVGGMSCIGSNAQVTARIVSGDASIDYVNVDLYEKGLKEVTTSLNKIMSYRIKSREEFIIELSVQGMGNMKVKVKPSRYEAETEVV